MSWLTWRQLRVQIFSSAAALAVLALVLAATGPHLAHIYDTSGLAHCRGNCTKTTRAFLNDVTSDPLRQAVYFFSIATSVLAPALLGAFWGAPLASRELEAGTLRLTWNQSVTRARWLAAKLAIVGSAAMALTGLLSLATTWWAVPIDRAGGYPAGSGQLSRFSPLIFAARGVTPIAYAAFAVVLGTVLGILLRRTLVAMAVTLAVVTAVQILVPIVVRPYLVAPARAVTAIYPTLDDLLIGHDGRTTVPVTIPGAWVLSNRTITATGQEFRFPTSPDSICQAGTRPACEAWLAGQNLRQVVVYQPANRFWTFQRDESAIYLLLALGLTFGSLWLIRRTSP